MSFGWAEAGLRECGGGQCDDDQRQARSHEWLLSGGVRADGERRFAPSVGQARPGSYDGRHAAYHSRMLVRDLAGHAELEAAVVLQEETWGEGFHERVPPSTLLVAQKLGGVVAGAFAPGGALVGFVFGMTGVRHGQLVHWSDMLAVRPEWRGHGVGQALKRFQRERCRALGIATIFWTFDPLAARNARLNLNRLGARVDDFVPDMYGANTGSPLHDLGTDRLVASWPVAAEPAPLPEDEALLDGVPLRRGPAGARSGPRRPAPGRAVGVRAGAGRPPRSAPARRGARAGVERVRAPCLRALPSRRLGGVGLRHAQRRPGGLPAVATRSGAECRSGTMSVRLERLALREIRLPLREPFRISSGVDERPAHPAARAARRQRRRRLERVRRRGRAELLAGDDRHRLADDRRRCVAPRVLGRPSRTRPRCSAVLDADFRGHNMAKAGGRDGDVGPRGRRSRAMPLARFIGGTRDAIATGISLGIQETPRAAGREGRAALAEGYRKIKIKIRPGPDVAFLRAAREALGPDAPLMADANNAYTLADADRLDRSSTTLGLMMIEQPLAWDDLVRHAELQKRLRTPICLDESITSARARAGHGRRSAAGRIINIKPGRVGGFAASLAIHDFCQDHGVPVWCGGMLESGIGRAYNVALASLPSFALPGDAQPERALLGARRRDAGVDDGATAWCACRSTGRASASTWTGSASSR